MTSPRSCAALQALEQGRVLRIHRNDLRPISCAARSMTSSPAHTSVSLLARAIRLPARMAASVGRRPTIPTTAVTTVSARGKRGRLDQALHPGRPPEYRYPPVGCEAPPPQTRPSGRHQLRLEPAGLLLQLVNAAVCGERRHLKAALRRPHPASGVPMEPVEPRTEMI